MGRIQRTRAWLLVLSLTVNGMELGAQEWRDSFFLRYGIKTPDFPSHCDGCGAPFTIYHALDCKKDGLIMARRNKLCDGFAELAGKAFSPAHVRDNPKIFTGRAVRGGSPRQKQQQRARRENHHRRSMRHQHWRKGRRRGAY